MALTDRGRVSADEADRAEPHRCPGCGRAVVLKRGRMVIAHFAHHVASICAWARGETHEHLGAKLAIAAAFAKRGLVAEIEAVVLSEGGDRRADVLVRQPSTGARVAIEIQHSPLGLDAVERRTRAYLAAQVPVIWIATLDPGRTKTRTVAPGVRVVDRYAVPDWQRFAAAYHGTLWFWIAGELWRGWLEAAWVARAPRGDMADDGWSPSRRWAALTLNGPFAPGATRVALASRPAQVEEDFALPGGRMARLVADGEHDPVPAPTVPIWRDWSQQTRPGLEMAGPTAQHPAVPPGRSRLRAVSTGQIGSRVA